MVCSGCKVLTGRDIIHADNECPQAYSFLCRRCHHRGHLTRHCPDKRWPQWERPATYEELIPVDVKIRLGIHTHTPLPFSSERGDLGTEQELNNVNEITIPTDYTDLLKFMNKNSEIKQHLPPPKDGKSNTKPAEESLIAAIKKWGVLHGYRIVQA
jgi:hypothetical protein